MPEKIDHIRFSIYSSYRDIYFILCKIGGYRYIAPNLSSNNFRNLNLFYERHFGNLERDTKSLKLYGDNGDKSFISFIEESGFLEYRSLKDFGSIYEFGEFDSFKSEVLDKLQELIFQTPLLQSFEISYDAVRKNANADIIKDWRKESSGSDKILNYTRLLYQQSQVLERCLDELDKSELLVQKYIEGEERLLFRSDGNVYLGKQHLGSLKPSTREFELFKLLYEKPNIPHSHEEIFITLTRGKRVEKNITNYVSDVKSRIPSGIRSLILNTKGGYQLYT